MSDLLATNEARAQLGRIASRFADGEREPVFFGPHRRAVGVIMSAEAYLEMVDQLDDYAIANEVMARLAIDSGERVGFDDLAAAAGLDPASFTDD
jgi:hypothetical protein